MVLTIGIADWMTGMLVVLFVFISGMVVLTILIQRPQGGGLAGAFGSGAGSGQTAFGAKTGDALTIFTIGMFIVWIGCAIGLNYIVKPPSAGAAVPVADATTQTPAPVAPAPEAPAPASNSKPGEPGAASTDKPAPADAPSAPKPETAPAGPQTPAGPPSGTPPLAPTPAPAPTTPPVTPPSGR